MYKKVIMHVLNKHPHIKQRVKNIYVEFGNLISDKITFPDNIMQISNTDHEHLFGYYDKSPWNHDGSKMIYLTVTKGSECTAASTDAQIILYDTTKKEEQIIGVSKTWNVQQGCMLQWRGPTFESEIIYNTFLNNEYKTGTASNEERSEELVKVFFENVCRFVKQNVDIDVKVDEFRYFEFDIDDKTEKLIIGSSTTTSQPN